MHVSAYQYRVISLWVYACVSACVHALCCALFGILSVMDFQQMSFCLQQHYCNILTATAHVLWRADGRASRLPYTFAKRSSLQSFNRRWGGWGVVFFRLSADDIVGPCADQCQLHAPVKDGRYQDVSRRFPCSSLLPFGDDMTSHLAAGRRLANWGQGREPSATGTWLCPRRYQSKHRSASVHQPCAPYVFLPAGKKSKLQSVLRSIFYLWNGVFL